jgi:hypothetical protein
MKKLLLAIIIILLLSGALLYYLYTRITYTPDWFDSHQFDVNSQMLTQSKGTTSKIYSELTKNKSSIVDENELKDFILEKINEKIPENSEKVIKALRSKIYPDKIVIESVINLDEIPFNNLSPNYQNSVKKFISSFPQKSRQNFYIKISGKPNRTDKGIELNENAKIQLGKMEYSVKTVINQISDNNQLDTNIPLNELPFKNIHLEEGKIILED